MYEAGTVNLEMGKKQKFINNLLEIMQEKITVEEIADPNIPHEEFIKHAFWRLLLKSGIGHIEDFSISFLDWLDNPNPLNDDPLSFHEKLTSFLRWYSKALSQVIKEYSHLKPQNEIKVQMYSQVYRELEDLRDNDQLTEKWLERTKELSKTEKSGDFVMADLMFLIDKLNRTYTS